MLPMKNENNEVPITELDASKLILSNLVQQYFTGKDEEILNGFLADFSLQNIGELIDTINVQLSNHMDIQNLTMSDIEQLNLFEIGKSIADSLTYNPTFQPLKKEVRKFEDTLKEFTHTALHDVAFPLMVMENPNVAVSAKNLIKRMIASIQNEENLDLSKVYEDLDIENLPVAPSVDMLLRLGGNIPGLEPKVLIEARKKEDERPCTLFCELTNAQAVYLANILQEDHDVIKDWKKFYYLLKSNGNKYESVVVVSDKKGLLLSILRILYNTKDFAQVRYLHTDKGNEMWPFFQEYLIDSRTDQLFQSELRKIPCKDEQVQQANKIINHLLDLNNQNKILQTAQEIFKKYGI
jgi:hypothetical protein